MGAYRTRGTCRPGRSDWAYRSGRALRSGWTGGTLWTSYAGRANGTGIALRASGTLFAGGTLGARCPIPREVDFQNRLVTGGCVLL